MFKVGDKVRLKKEKDITPGNRDAPYRYLFDKVGSKPAVVRYIHGDEPIYCYALYRDGRRLLSVASHQIELTKVIIKQLEL